MEGEVVYIPTTSVLDGRYIRNEKMILGIGKGMLYSLLTCQLIKYIYIYLSTSI